MLGVAVPGVEGGVKAGESSDAGGGGCVREGVGSGDGCEGAEDPVEAASSSSAEGVAGSSGEKKLARSTSASLSAGWRDVVGGE